MSYFGDFTGASPARKLDMFDRTGNYDSTLSVVLKVCRTSKADMQLHRPTNSTKDHKVVDVMVTTENNVNVVNKHIN